jgi:hypothetical protein
VVLRPALIAGLFRVFPASMTFYAVSALLVAGLAALGFASFTGLGLLVVPAMALAGATGLFVYARLLGRLGSQLSDLQAPQPEEPAQHPASSTRRPPRKRRPVRGVKTIDPWAVPKKKARAPRESASELEAYGIAPEDAPAAPPEPPSEAPARSRPQEEAYGVCRDEPPPDSRHPTRAEDETTVTKEADASRGNERQSKPARALTHPFLEGVYSFPWYEGNVRPWMVVAGGLLAMGGLLQVMLSFLGQLQ